MTLEELAKQNQELAEKFDSLNERLDAQLERSIKQAEKLLEYNGKIELNKDNGFFNISINGVFIFAISRSEYEAIEKTL